jgi:serine protease Do
MPHASDHSRKDVLPARRLALLGSVAVIGSAILFTGPLGYGRLVEQAFAAAPLSEVQGPVGFADLVAKVKPAVISVRVKMDENVDTPSFDQNSDDMPPFLKGTPFERFFREYGFNNFNFPQGRMQRHKIITGVGSGFFISADGYAVTNDHVVDHAKSVQVTTDDGTVYTARVIGVDAKTDLALIKVDAKKDFAFVSFGGQAPRVGDWVVAVGNPYGLGGTVTAGIISAEGRDIGSNPYDDYIQIDAPINKGNSGGPAFDTSGNVIGVNTAIYSPNGGSVGIGFAIPATTAKQVVAQLKEHGKVTRAWLGVQVQPVTADIAESLGMKQAAGALVAETEAGAPAAKAGIQPGDVITAVDGTEIKDSRSLARQISTMAPDNSVKLDILRNGEAKTITVTLATMPSELPNQVGAREPEGQSDRSVAGFGLSVAPAEDVAGAGSKGVVVTAVDPEGTAAEHGLKSGDVILEVGGKSVSNASDLRQAVSAAKSDGKHVVLMLVKTAGNTHFVAMPVG